MRGGGCLGAPGRGKGGATAGSGRPTSTHKQRAWVAWPLKIGEVGADVWDPQHSAERRGPRQSIKFK
jgi:hypothetical protein